MDVFTTDKPAADTAHFLEHGNESLRRTCTRGPWKPGDLIGENGSDPDTKARSASYAAPDQWDKITERHSATSTGHVPHHPRPANVSLGWGGYDKFTHWQACGRQVTKDMVEKEDWSTDLLQPMKLYNEAGELVDIVPPSVKAKHLPLQTHPPPTLYEVVNATDKRNLQPPAPRNHRSAAFSGTEADEI